MRPSECLEKKKKKKKNEPFFSLFSLCCQVSACCSNHSHPKAKVYFFRHLSIRILRLWTSLPFLPLLFSIRSGNFISRTKVHFAQMLIDCSDKPSLLHSRWVSWWKAIPQWQSPPRNMMVSGLPQLGEDPGMATAPCSPKMCTRPWLWFGLCLEGNLLSTNHKTAAL